MVISKELQLRLTGSRSCPQARQYTAVLSVGSAVYRGRKVLYHFAFCRTKRNVRKVWLATETGLATHGDAIADLNIGLCTGLEYLEKEGGRWREEKRRGGGWGGGGKKTRACNPHAHTHTHTHTHTLLSTPPPQPPTHSPHTQFLPLLAQ